MCNRLDPIPGCVRQTDGQTDKQTDILPRHSQRYAYASRGNKTGSYRNCSVLYCVPTAIMPDHVYEWFLQEYTAGIGLTVYV